MPGPFSRYEVDTFNHIAGIRRALDNIVDRLDRLVEHQTSEVDTARTLIQRALSEYTVLVWDIGRGFHPDTPGDAYTSLPERYRPSDIDRITEQARTAGVDVYGIALDVIGAKEGVGHGKA